MVAFPDSRHKSEVLGSPQCITLNRLVTPAQVHFLLSVSLSQSKEMSWETLAIIYQFIHGGCFITAPPHVTHPSKGRRKKICLALEPRILHRQFGVKYALHLWTWDLIQRALGQTESVTSTNYVELQSSPLDRNETQICYTNHTHG